MEGLTWENATLARRRQRRNRRNAILALLGCLVVFATAYALTMPAISMTAETSGSEAASGDLVAASFGESPMSAAATPSASTQSGSILDDGSVSLVGANDWQIVSGAFEGNAPAQKTSVGNDSYQAVRVQKNVVPTDVENEFLVYLSIDTKLLVKEYLQFATYEATTSNNYHSEDLGTVVTAMTGNQKVQVSGESRSGWNSAKFTIQDSAGNTIVKDTTLWWSQANNVTFYLKTSTGTYILMGVEVRKNSSNTVRLSAEAEKHVYEDVMKVIALDGVTDVMGGYIDFLGVERGDYDTTPTCANGVLSWQPSMKGSPAAVTTGSGANIVTWNLNVAELVYKVRLNVAKDGFKSCALNMASTVGQAESYPVNQEAAVNYTVKVGGTAQSGKSAVFPVPYVRGLLYDLKLKKVDEAGESLPGATFSLAGSGNDVASTVTRTAVSDEDGIVTFSGLPWGTYMASEEAAPSGYSKSDEEKSATLCQTDARDALARSDVDSTHMMLADWASALKFTNEKSKSADITLKKTDSESGEPLAGAEFELLRSDTAEGVYVKYAEEHQDAVYAVASDGDGKGTVKLAVPDGYYQLHETKAPAGHVITGPPIAFQVSNGAVVAASVRNAAYGDGVLVVQNAPGNALPTTGGTGTLPYTLGGLALMATALVYGFRMRLRGRRLRGRPLDSS